MISRVCRFVDVRFRERFAAFNYHAGARLNLFRLSVRNVLHVHSPDGGGWARAEMLRDIRVARRGMSRRAHFVRCWPYTALVRPYSRADGPRVM